MPDPVDADSIKVAAASPASASVDGRAATAVSISEQIKAAQFGATDDALTGTNANGGARSGWNALRPAIARYRSPG